MPAKYHVLLNDEQRDQLDDLTRTGTKHVRVVQHARTLLLTDTSDEGSAWDDERIAEALGCSPATVARTRKRFCVEGLDEAIRVRKSGPGRPRKIDGTAEAHRIALACSSPPEGRALWTTRLLADRYVELGISEGWLDEPVGRETIRLTQYPDISARNRYYWSRRRPFHSKPPHGPRAKASSACGAWITR